MATGLKTAGKPDSAPAADSVSRKPQQNRSKASLERMLSATRELMLERGSEEFTLQEVSQLGQVSIGSIYLRFESKEKLVRTVIAHSMEDLAAAEDAMFIALEQDCQSLSAFVPAYVEAYAEVLRVHAPLLKLAMQRAAYDPQVSEPGKGYALRALEQSSEAMLRYSGEFGGGDLRLKANSAYFIIYATLARELSLGSTGESAAQYDWGILKRELGAMCLAYLRAG